MLWYQALVLLLPPLSVCIDGELSIENNGYVRVVVAISPYVSVAYEKQLIKAIKEGFTEASVALYEASRRRLYFKSVHILVPYLWTSSIKTDESSSDEAYETAHFRIIKPSMEAIFPPSTMNVLGCGQPGRFVEVPLYFFTRIDKSREQVGHIGRTLVHEWSHLRYGVFDEYADADDPKFPQFYFEQRKDEQYLVKPTSCHNAEVNGQFIHMYTGKACTKKDLVLKRCRFKASSKQEKNLRSSIMGLHYLPGVTMFCDDNNYKHDKNSLNRHNQECNRKSTWDIVSRHPDFSDAVSNPASDLSESDLTPTFKLIKPSQGRFIIVIDQSGSMGNYRRMDKVRESATRWLREEVETGTAVGIVTFSDYAKPVSEIKTIHSPATRNILSNMLKINPGGVTCIACGIDAALKMLKRDEKQHGHRGGTLILMTDGEENRNWNGKTMLGMLPSLKQERLRVISIAYSHAADQKLEKLSLETNGKVFLVKDRSSTRDLDVAFTSTAVYQNDVQKMTNVRIEILIEHVEKASQKEKRTFRIDSSIGKDLRVRIVYTNRAAIKDFYLVQPSGTTYPKNKLRDMKDTKTLQYDIPQAEIGEWNVHFEVKSAGSQDFSLSVASRSRLKDKPPIITECELEQRVIKYDDNLLVPIVARVVQGEEPIVNAKVIARIVLPDNRAIEMELKDNGAGADRRKDDGIYSRYLTVISTKGRYDLTCQTVNKGTAFIVGGGFTGNRATGPNGQKLNKTKADSFQRVANTGTFQSEKDVPAGSNLPPNKITDLVANLVDDNTQIQLNWTAPGDDLDSGQAKSYDIRYSSNAAELDTNTFNKSAKLKGIIKPEEAGTPQSMTFQIPEDMSASGPWYFCIVTFDQKGKASEPSNLGFVLVGEVVMVLPKKAVEEIIYPYIIAGVLAGVVVLLIVVAVVLYRVKGHLKFGQKLMEGMKINVGNNTSVNPITPSVDTVRSAHSSMKPQVGP